MGRRKQPRTEAQLNVKLWGTDASGKPFIDPAVTRNVSAEGVLLEGVKRTLKPGDAVGITYRDHKARFRVAWVGTGNPAGLVGLEKTSQGACIWDVPLQSGPDLYVNKRNAERRQFTRIECQASIEIRTPSAAAPIRGRLVDLSLGGCYAEMQMPLKVGNTLELAIWLDESKLRTAGLVTSSHPGFGIGVKFIAMGRNERQQLEQYLSKQSGKTVSLTRLGTAKPTSAPGENSVQIPQTVKDHS
jgi:hypothetical protein